jgi:hypothetical protein
MRVYLDDKRHTPGNFTHRVYTAQEAIDLLKTGKVKHISLDHDLGDETEVGSGYDVARFIEEEAYFKRLPELTWAVHSDNAVGIKNMTVALTNADRYWNR